MLNLNVKLKPFWSLVLLGNKNGACDFVSALCVRRCKLVADWCTGANNRNPMIPAHV